LPGCLEGGGAGVGVIVGVAVGAGVRVIVGVRVMVGVATGVGAVLHAASNSNRVINRMPETCFRKIIQHTYLI
jgi:hypothetical protein